MNRGVFAIAVAVSGGLSMVSCPEMHTSRTRESVALPHPRPAEAPATKEAPSKDLPSASLSPLASVAKCPVGTNLGLFSDYSIEWPLFDVFKQTRGWISGTDDAWDDRRPLELDENGWVRRLAKGQIARTVVFWADGATHPAGDYVVTYDGDGDLDFWTTGTIRSKTPGRLVVRVGHQPGGISINLTRVDPEDPMRNIRMFLPGGACTNDPRTACRTDAECHGGACVLAETESRRSPFHPDFLNGLRGYGVVRFMDWMHANETTERTWSDRPKPTDANFSDRGVPVEVMVALANELGEDPWFTLPYAADDDYVRHFAEYVRDHAKSRRIYVEYSNEVWNPQFPQFDYARTEGTRLGLGAPDVAGLRFYARRSTQIFRIFEEVFGGAERLVRVLASQAAAPQVSEAILAFDDAAKHADALAIAPYFGSELGAPPRAVDVLRMPLNELIAELGGPALARVAEWMRGQSDVAHRFGLKLISYEGGQHLVGVGPLSEDATLNALFDAANRDPRMRQIYLDYLTAWRRAGGELFMHYTSFGAYSRFGRWGAVERVGERRDEAPKLDALLTYAKTRPLEAPR